MILQDILFCDDIRFEKDNKISVMGLYNDIVFHNHANQPIKWPQPLKLAILLRFRLEEKDKPHPNKFEFEYLLNNKSILTAKGNLNIDSIQSHISLALTVNNLQLEPGNLGFKVKLLDESKVLFAEEKSEAIRILNQPGKLE